MASVNRGCTVHGKNVGLHGDKTSTGAQCIAARPGMSVMGKWKLYIGDKTTPCPKCGKVGVIVTGDHRHSNGAAVAVDGAEILCGCPSGSNFLIAPGTVEVNTPTWATTPVEPEQHAQTAKKKRTGVDAGFCVVPQQSTTESFESILFAGGQPEGTRELYRSLNGAGKEYKAGSILFVVDPDKQDSEQIAHMQAAKQRIDTALAPLSHQQANFLFKHKDTIEIFAAAASTASDTYGYSGQATEAAKGYFEQVEKILVEIEKTYKNQYITSGTLFGEQFFVERRRLFGQLDSVLKMFMKHRFMFNEYTDLKSALGLSSRSITHRWNETGVSDIEGYATHIEKLAKYVKWMETAGKIGIGLSAFDTAAKITEACTVGRDCAKTSFTSIGEFAGSLAGGALASRILQGSAASSICAVVLGTASIEAGGAGALLCTIGVSGGIAYGTDKTLSGLSGATGEFIGEKLGLYEATSND
jgi:uncharacterized Zn-binding protein involved in type VI secretion